jgi:hypothetical protein
MSVQNKNQSGPGIAAYLAKIGPVPFFLPFSTERVAGRVAPRWFA